MLQVCWAYAIFAEANGAANVTLTDDSLVAGQATPIISGGQVVGGGASWTVSGLELLDTGAVTGSGDDTRNCALCDALYQVGAVGHAWMFV